MKTEVQDTLARITERVTTPVIVDADTGFGNAINVQRTVRGFERAGAAMVQMEDQDFAKRCGHLDGKAVIGSQEMCGKLRAALDARHDTHTLILARTDALAVDSGWHRACRGAHLAALLPVTQNPPDHGTPARRDAGLRPAQYADRHTGIAGAGGEVFGAFGADQGLIGSAS